MDQDTQVCRKEGCDRVRTEFSVYCIKHHLEQLEKQSEPCDHIPQSKRDDFISSLDERNEIKDLLLGNLELGPFDEYFKYPDEFYSQGWPKKPADWPEFKNRVLVPLWQHEERVFVLDTAKGTKPILSFFAECADEYEQHSCIDEAIFEMIELHVWEYGGSQAEAAEAKELAEKLSLPNIEELNNILENHEDCSEDDFQKFKRNLIE